MAYRDGLPPEAPALLTRISTRPNSTMVRSIMAAHGFLIAHVGGLRPGRGGPEREFFGGLVDAAGQLVGGLLAFGGDHDVGAFPRQAQGQGFSDSAAGAGDYRDAAVEIGMQSAVSIWHSSIKASIDFCRFVARRLSRGQLAKTNQTGLGVLSLQGVES